MQDTAKTPNNSPQGQVKFFTWEYEIPVKKSSISDKEDLRQPQTAETLLKNDYTEVTAPSQLHTEFEDDTAQVAIDVKSPYIEIVAEPEPKQISYNEVNYDVPPYQHLDEPVLNVGNKRYTASNNFGKLAVIFNDRKMMYYLFSALFLVSSTVVATLIFKLAETGNYNPFSYITKYDLYSRTLPKSFFGAFLLSAPILISSLFVFFGGFTIFSKFISSLWIITFGAFWSIFAVHVFSSFGILQKIIFIVLSAVVALSCIVFSAEAGKYSYLTYYGKNELLKFSNVKNFSIIYLLFCSITCSIIFLYLKFAVIK